MHPDSWCISTVLATDVIWEASNTISATSPPSLRSFLHIGKCLLLTLQHSDVTVKSRVLFDRAEILSFFVIRGSILPGFNTLKNSQNGSCGASK